MPVRTRVIHRPVARKRAAIAVGKAGVVGITVNIGIAEPGPYPFSLLVPIGWPRKVVVFDGGIFFKGLLRAKEAPSGEDRHETKGDGDAYTHERNWANSKS